MTQEFKDHIVQHPNRFRQTTVAPGVVELTPTWEENPGEVIQLGTPIDRQLFNGITSQLADIAQDITSVDSELQATKISLLSDISTARTEQISPARIDANSLPSSKLKISADSDRLKLANMSDEVLQAMAGTTSVNATPSALSVTNEKVAPKGISPDKTDFVVVGKNKFNKDAVTANKYVNPGDGNLLDNTTYTASDFIPVSPSTQYTMTKYTAVTRIAYFTAAKVYISGALGPGATITTPATAYYARFSFETALGVAAQQFEQGAAVTAYEPYGFEMAKLQKVGANSVDSSALKPLSVTSDKIGFALPTFAQNKNLYNKSAVTAGFFVNQLSGALIANADHYVSDFIPVSPSTQYSFNSVVGSRIAYYTDTKTYISGAVDPASPVTTPATAKFARISHLISLNKDVAQFEQGAALSAYTPFGYAASDLLIESTPSAKVLNLPPKLFGLVGQELNIYFDNIIEGRDTEYTFDVVCSKGQQYENFWRLTPSVAETLALSINVSQNGKLVATASTSIVIKATSVGTGVNKNVIVIGDSTTNSGFAVTKLNENFNADPMNVTMLGTRGTAPNNHEGRSGWTARNYVENADVSGVVNAFWNPGTSSFDFGYYMTQTGFATPDYVVINLGINDVFGAADDTVAESDATNLISRYNTMINSIKAYNPSIKIGIAVTIPPNYSQDAFGRDYSSGQTRTRYKRNNIIIVKRLIEAFKNREGESLYLVPIHTNIDTRYNYGVEQKAVNARNATTVSTAVAGSGVHPAESGYWQVADVYWYFLKSFES